MSRLVRNGGNEEFALQDRRSRSIDENERVFGSYPDNPKEALLDPNGDPAGANFEPSFGGFKSSSVSWRRRLIGPSFLKGSFTAVIGVILVLLGAFVFRGFHHTREASQGAAPANQLWPGAATPPSSSFLDPEDPLTSNPDQDYDAYPGVDSSSSTLESPDISAEPLTASFGGLKMRLLPMGDSITFGYGSQSGNGYRGQLYDALASQNEVEMVGGVEAGNMSQPFCDGYFGQIIMYIENEAKRSLQWRPNVVLLHAGTNDCNKQVGQELEEAPGRLGLLIDLIHRTCEDAAIIVAQLIPARNTTLDGNIQRFNKVVADIVEERAKEGMHVQLVDLYTPFKDDPGDNPKANYLDGLHPNYRGYKLMAQGWLKGLTEVAEKGWIKDPVPFSRSDLSFQGRRKLCISRPNWVFEGRIFDGSQLGRNLFQGPDCYAHADNKKLCTCHYPDGATHEIFALSESCATTGFSFIRTIRFADLTGDGKADLIHIHDDGAFSVFQNTDDGFKFLDFGVIPEHSRTEWTQFGDINGDGIADMLVSRANGAVDAWTTSFTNGGLSFHAMGTIFDGLRFTSSGIRFWDMNGDQVADLCYVDPEGNITTRVNFGIKNGKVEWGPEIKLQFSGSGSRDGTDIADIGGDGWGEYIIIDRTTGYIERRLSGRKLDLYFRQETLFDGTRRLQDGRNVMFADITGNGRADLLYVDPQTSVVTMWRNGCVSERGMKTTYTNDTNEVQS